MDIIVFVLLELFALILTLFSFMGPRAGWAIFAVFGTTLGSITALILNVDADLTSGGTTLAAANGNFISDFNGIAVLSILLAVAPVYVGVRRTFKI